jgi:uncharacterized protein
VRPEAATRLGFAYGQPTLAPVLAAVAGDPTHEVEYEQWVPASPDAVFPFFADATNLEAITPPFLRFRVVGTSTAAMARGTRIEHRLTVRGIPLRWQSLITDWHPARRFVDVQTRGPYAVWQHTHEFEAFAGGTILRDRVRYALPLGVAGDLVAGGVVARDVDAIFAYRRAAIAGLFGERAPARP